MSLLVGIAARMEGGEISRKRKEARCGSGGRTRSAEGVDVGWWSEELPPWHLKGIGTANAGR
jgi:hypothetical protein